MTTRGGAASRPFLGPASARGLTLIELMIVILVLGVLVSLAYPNYRQFATRATRTEAKAALLQIAANQERWYLNNNAYTTDLRNLGFDVADNYETDTGSYEISVVAADTNNFTATATYLKDNDEKNRCGTFSIDARNAKTSAPYNDCWTRSR